MSFPTGQSQADVDYTETPAGKEHLGANKHVLIGGCVISTIIVHPLTSG